MKLKVISDGTALGTKVINAETGEAIENISRISWELDASVYIAQAVIEVIEIPVELTGGMRLLKEQVRA